jgi:hypothetical protein
MLTDFSNTTHLHSNQSRQRGTLLPFTSKGLTPHPKPTEEETIALGEKSFGDGSLKVKKLGVLTTKRTNSLLEGTHHSLSS